MVANVERLYAPHVDPVPARRYAPYCTCPCSAQLTARRNAEPNNRSPLNVEAADLWDNTEAVSAVLPRARECLLTQISTSTVQERARKALPTD